MSDCEIDYPNMNTTCLKCGESFYDPYAAHPGENVDECAECKADSEAAERLHKKKHGVCAQLGCHKAAWHMGLCFDHCPTVSKWLGRV